MKKFTTFIIAAFVIISIKAETLPSEDYAGGNGSKSNPYKIATLAQLRHLSETVGDWSFHFKLIADIDASDTKTWNVSNDTAQGFSPIGTSSSIVFIGSFDGNGHTIRNLYIYRPNQDYVGLFGYSKNIAIKSLALIKYKITGNNYVGGIAGRIYESTIKNCLASGTIKSNKYGGMLLACNGEYSVIRNSFSTGQINGNSYVGGLIGVNTSNALIQNCYTSGTIKGDSQVGAIAGYSSSSYVINCFYDTKTTGINTGVGTGFATSDFSDINNFSGWDFDNMWQIATVSELDPSPRPYLKWWFNNYIVSVESNIDNAGDIAGETSCNTNDQISLTTTARVGYKFICWRLGNTVVSNSNTYTFTYTADSSQVYEAVFSQSFSFAGGDGSKENPYKIKTLEQLHYLSNLTNLWSKSFELIADIDASGTRNWNPIFSDSTYGFKPIGNNSDEFTGTFNGKNHVISNLYVNSGSYSGLFGKIKSAKIKDLSLTNCEIYGSNYIGALTGDNYLSTISNCHSSGTVNSKGSWAGGLVGYTYDGSISLSSSSCNVVSQGSCIGGLIGYSNSSVSYCNASGNLSGIDYVGGLIGKIESSVDYCYATGNVTGNSYLGGFIGSATYSTVTNCYASGSIDGTDHIGGLIGYNEYPVLSCYAYGAVNGTTNTGGLIGLNFSYEIVNCYSDTLSAGVADNYGFGLTTSDFSNANNFTDWDFNSIWTIAKATDNNLRPVLKWQLFDRLLSTSCNISNAGSVSGGGSYNSGDEITLLSTENLGYSFIGWKLGENIISTNNPYTFTYTADSSQTYIAVFEENFNFSGGDGSDENPYQIETLEQLRLLSEVNALWDKNFILISDIDASDTRIWNISENEDTLGFSPIGFNHPNYFSGSFNGNYHIVSNLYINRPNQRYIGLFGYLGTATVKNLGLINCNITGSSYTGGICGYNNYSVTQTNCFSSGEVNGSDYVGGLTGYSEQNSYISNCFSLCNVDGRSVGGLVGMNEYGNSINYCYSAGRVSGTETGGLFYRSSTNSSVINCFYDGTTSGQSVSDGGTLLNNSQFEQENSFIGWDFNNYWEIDSISLDTCRRPYFKWQLHDFEIKLESNIANAGTLAGPGFTDQNEEISLIATPKSCYAFTGWSLNGTIVSTDNPYNFTFTANSPQTYVAQFEEDYSFAGGTGSESNPYQIATLEQLEYLSVLSSLWNKHFLLTSDIDASDTRYWNIESADTLGFSPIGNRSIQFTGTFNGNGHSISNLYINRPSQSYIGLFGYASVATIRNTAIINCNMRGYYNCGILVGYNYLTDITECFATGTLVANGYAGGLAGDISYSSITNCFTNCTLTSANYYAGGLYANGYTEVSIVNCYALGTATGPNGTYVLAGSTSTTPVSCYYDTLYNEATSKIATGISTNDFSSSGNFSGWDFDNVWEISTITEIDENPRPYLKWQIKDHLVTLRENIKYAGILTGAGSYNNGDEVTISAEAKTGYVFTGWKLDNDIVSSESSYTFNLSDGTSYMYVAQFEGDYSFAGGDGTEENPYQIETLTQLEYLSNVSALWDKHFELIADIDASNTSTWNKMGSETLGFSPIGDISYGSRQQISFTGSFNGNSHTISNLYINRPEEESVGLFGKTKGSTIQHLKISNANITGNSYTGGLVGMASLCNITDIAISGIISGGSYTGGLLGYMRDTTKVYRCCSDANVASLNKANYTGGLIGYSYYSETNECFVTGNVNAFSRVGGLIGLNAYSQTLNCLTTGNVNCNYYISGGLFGITYSIVENCYSTGKVTGHYDGYQGGFTGGAESYSNASLQNCYFDIETSCMGVGIGEDYNYAGEFISGYLTESFKSSSNFYEWDFDSIWSIGIISQIDENPRPYLKWMEIDEILPVDENKLVTSTSEKILIYPNPASTAIHVMLAEDTKLSIIGIDGKLIVNNRQIEANSLTSIDISSLQSGLYFLRTVSSEGIVSTHKIIVE